MSIGYDSFLNYANAASATAIGGYFNDGGTALYDSLRVTQSWTSATYLSNKGLFLQTASMSSDRSYSAFLSALHCGVNCFTRSQYFFSASLNGYTFGKRSSFARSFATFELHVSMSAQSERVKHQGGRWAASSA